MIGCCHYPGMTITVRESQLLNHYLQYIKHLFTMLLVATVCVYMDMYDITFMFITDGELYSRSQN